MDTSSITTPPDTAMLQTVREHWEKMFTLLLWKLRRAGTTTITTEDMREYHRCIGDRVLLTLGHFDSISYSFVSLDEAKAIAAWDAEHVGHA